MAPGTNKAKHKASGQSRRSETQTRRRLNPFQANASKVSTPDCLSALLTALVAIPSLALKTHTEEESTGTSAASRSVCTKRLKRLRLSNTKRGFQLGRDESGGVIFSPPFFFGVSSVLQELSAQRVYPQCCSSATSDLPIPWWSNLC